MRTSKDSKMEVEPKSSTKDGEPIRICKLEGINNLRHNNRALNSNSKFEELNNKYKILREIGRGSYGVVFKGICMVDYDESKGLEYYDRDEIEDKDDGVQRFAIKRIFPTINAPYILIEMLILKMIKGHEYITNLVAGYRKESQVSLVFEYQRSQSFLVFVESIEMNDIKLYLHQLLSSVKHLSDKGIVHRDIKPSNFLWDPKSK